ncbi:MAG: orotate phosphoribosyltransferase [Clostridia bacterium]|nr:orotate phosphoribosyltransferase [Clostridia bacterium]
MTQKEIIAILKDCEAFLEGHFLLSSGLHSGGYCQCAKLLRFPDKAAVVLGEVAAQVKELGVTKVCGPAMGGIVVSYELARQLGVESIFTERKDGVMQLRRGFTAGKGDKILISEDVVTTGKSTMETVEALTAMGAEVVGVACIADRTKGESALSMPIYSAVKLDFPTYEADACPLCKAGIPLVKPGSRAELKG